MPSALEYERAENWPSVCNQVWGSPVRGGRRDRLGFAASQKRTWAVPCPVAGADGSLVVAVASAAVVLVPLPTMGITAPVSTWVSLG